jgi:hypothetical protein
MSVELQILRQKLNQFRYQLCINGNNEQYAGD